MDIDHFKVIENASFFHLKAKNIDWRVDSKMAKKDFIKEKKEKSKMKKEKERRKIKKMQRTFLHWW